MENLEKEKIKQTFENLRKNNFEVYYAENKEAAKQQIFSLIEKGQSVAMGGSMTLKEIGVPEMLRCGDYRYLDRSAPEMTPEKAKQGLPKRHDSWYSIFCIRLGIADKVGQLR